MTNASSCCLKIQKIMGFSHSTQVGCPPRVPQAGSTRSMAESGLQAAPSPLPSLTSLPSSHPPSNLSQTSRGPHLARPPRLPPPVQPPAGAMRSHEVVCFGLSSFLPVRHAEAQHSRAASSSVLRSGPAQDRLQVSQTSARLTELSQPRSSPLVR